MLLALVPGTLALSAHPRIPISHRCAAPRMTFLSGREDLNEASGELRASGRAGAVREAVPRAAAGGSPVTEQMPATWADAAERLAEMRAMQELNENECVIEEPCMPDGGIVLLRHGESEWNAANRFTGWYDVPLTARGELEALDAAASLRASGVCVDVVYTSTLKRTVKTAWLVLEALDRFTVPIHHRWQLNERMYGALTGLNKAETRQFLGDGPFEKLRRQPPPLERGSCYDPAMNAALRGVVAASPPATEAYRAAAAQPPARSRDAIGSSGRDADVAAESAGQDVGGSAGGDTEESVGGAAGGYAGSAAAEQAWLAGGPRRGGGAADADAMQAGAQDWPFGGGAAFGGVQVPTAESFEDTRDRVLPCWEGEILPLAKAGKTVLVVSSKNTLRALIHGITGMPMTHAVDLDVPNGVPIVFYPETRSLSLLGSDKALGSVSAEVADGQRSFQAAAAAAAAAVPVVEAASTPGKAAHVPEA